MQTTIQYNGTRSSTLRGGMDKVQRYKWADLKNPGEFAMIAKEELHVDHSYQRDKINEGRVNEVASNWDWVMCGALSVSERDGQWFVMDGQHRKLAADKRSDIKELPCMVFALESQQKEAGAFVGLNSQKTAVSGIDKFKAMIVAGDKSAIGLNAVLQSTGHKASSTSSTKGVACLLCLWKLFKRDEAQFKSLWPLLADMCTGTTIVDGLVRGIWGCELKANEKKLSLTNPPLRTALIQVGGAVLAAEIRREVGIVGRGGERVESAAVLKWINRQRLGAKYKLPTL
jgi:hypothetical protein